METKLAANTKKAPSATKPAAKPAATLAKVVKTSSNVSKGKAQVQNQSKNSTDSKSSGRNRRRRMGRQRVTQTSANGKVSAPKRVQGQTFQNNDSAASARRTRRRNRSSRNNSSSNMYTMNGGYDMNMLDYSSQMIVNDFINQANAMNYGYDNNTSNYPNQMMGNEFINQNNTNCGYDNTSNYSNQMMGNNFTNQDNSLVPSLGNMNQLELLNSLISTAPQQSGEGLKFAVVDVGSPGGRIPYNKRAVFEEAWNVALANLILSSDSSLPSLQLKRCQFEKGIFIVKVASKNCGEVLCRMVEYMPSLWPGCRLTAVEKNNVPELPCKARFFVRGHGAKLPSQSILEMLGRQNEGLRVECWGLVNRDDMVDGTLMVVSIDQESRKTLEKTNGRAFFLTSTVSFKLAKSSNQETNNTQNNRSPRQGAAVNETQQRTTPRGDNERSGRGNSGSQNRNFSMNNNNNNNNNNSTMNASNNSRNRTLPSLLPPELRRLIYGNKRF